MHNIYDKYKPQLDFIDKYSKASNAATGSKFDSNANVETKNVTTLSGEIHKEADIGIAGGVGEGLLIKKGQVVKKVKEDAYLAYTFLRI